MFQDFNKWFKSKLRKESSESEISLKSSSFVQFTLCGDVIINKKTKKINGPQVTWTGVGVWCRAASTLLNSEHPHTDTQSYC